MLVAGGGWHNEAETTLLEELRDSEPESIRAQPAAAQEARAPVPLRQTRRFLVTLIREGARRGLSVAVTKASGFPFSNPWRWVTPVVTSRRILAAGDCRRCGSARRPVRRR